MKTLPFEHQVKLRDILRANEEYYALGNEQGTGKTWSILDDAEYQFLKGRIDALCIIAPKGVHTNWITREIPTHMEIKYTAGIWKSGAGKRYMKNLIKILDRCDEDQFKILAVNIDALNTKKGFKFAKEFISNHAAMTVVDESSRIKSITSSRTKKAIALGTISISRRIASGTVVTQGPQDLFPQFEFLKANGGLLGTTSYRAFVAEFAEIEPNNSGLLRHIVMRQLGAKKFHALAAQHAQAGSDLDLITFIKLKMKQDKQWFQPPQLIKRDSNGAPIYKNLGKLKKLIKPYVFRVLKKDCLDLPKQVYKTLTFDLLPSQQKIYEQIEYNLRYERDNGELDTFTALTKMIKIRQIVSGFVMLDGDPGALMPRKDNPRMNLLNEIIEDTTGQFIIWATFREELKQIAKLCAEKMLTYVEYHGGIKDKIRGIAIDAFQAGRARVFIGNPQSGGIGLNLTAATTSINYSQDFNLETALQRDARNHRIGSKEVVEASEHESILYITLCASATIDERVANALERKEDVAKEILNYL